MVLLHLGLAVLAAWGLSLLLRRVQGRAERAAFLAAALLLTAIEYRAAPIDFPVVEKQAAPVYRWLGTVRLPGAVLELPIGFDYDAEHVFRSTAHWQPLVNGYSGFAPRHYDDLRSLFESRSVPGEAWTRARELGAVLLILHPHEGENLVRLNLARATRKAISEGKLEMLGSFPHDASRDFVLRFAEAPPFETGIPPADRKRAAGDFERLTTIAESELAPPFGVIDVPTENAEVAAGSWGYGWALDDSGIAEVRVATEVGSSGGAVIHQQHPGIAELYPDYPDKDGAGFGFIVPTVKPGPHTLILTVVARDGGERKLVRPIRIR
jgi:hypothetical protein